MDQEGQALEELKNQPQLDQDKLNHLCQLLEQTLLALDKHKDLEANNKISQQLSEHKHSLLNHPEPLSSQVEAVEVFSEAIKKQNLRRKNKLNQLKHHHSLETLLLLLEIIQQLLQCLAILRILQVQIKLP